VGRANGRGITTRRWLRAAGLVLGIAGFAATAVPAGAAPAGSGSPAGAGSQKTGYQKVVTLPTGDRLVVQFDAGGAVRSAHPVAGSGRAYLTETAAGETYVVPATALAKLGTGALSMSQFDVTALATGKAGVEPGTGTAHPDFPMRTLTVDVTDPDGQPVDDAGLAVVNLDDSREYLGFPEVYDGEARISVPDGHYALLAYYYTGDTNTGFKDLIDFGSVTVDGADTSTTLAMADATNHVTVATPKPARVQGLDFTWARGSSESTGVTWGLSLTSDTLYLSSSPNGPGVQHHYVHETLTSPKSAIAPYLYDVEFPGDGPIGTDQSYTATAASLAAVDSKYYSDQPDRTGDSVWFEFVPWASFELRTIITMAAPLHRVEYVSGNPQLTYQEYVDAYFDEDNFVFGGTETTGMHVFQPGERTSAEWLRGPVVPGVPAWTGTGDYACGACRVDDTLSIALTPVTDSTPDHAGYLDQRGGRSRFRLYQGNTTLVDQRDVTGADVTVPADDETYKIAYDQTRTADWTAQSTKTHTVWTFDSAHSGSTTVPAGWSCTQDTVRKHCSALPLLLPHYQLSEGLDGTEAPGSTGSLALTVGHAPGAAQSEVDDATVSVSFDGGTTWTDATVQSLGGNQFRAHWTNPDSGMVSFKVTATDTAGNTLSQTTDDALTIGGTA
jgi:hypothetical protein